MNIDYNAVIEILKSFLNNEKTEILGISVGEERQVRDAIKDLLTAYEKEKSENVKLRLQDIPFIKGQLEGYKYRVNELKKELEKEKEKNSNAKWYIHQEIVRIEEDIEDYIDDDKEDNKHIIGEFKENLKQWKDVEKLLDGKSKDDLYIDWREYGEYE